MSKQRQTANEVQTEANHEAGGSGSASPVGYGRPPVHTRFKPGESGNPKGRKKGQRNVKTVLTETLNQRITIRQGERTRSVTKLDGIILTVVTNAIKGDPKAIAPLLAIMRSTGMVGEAPEAAEPQRLTADDEALLADFLRRHGQQSEEN
jgi:hypothetical protein